MLEIILNKKRKDILKLIITPLEDGLIILKENHIYFVHDKIQQACYQLNPKEQLPHIHFEIANVLLESGMLDNIGDLFSIVSHLENSFNFVKASPEKYFRVFLNAAIKSKEISAYKEFMRYIERCMDLIYPGIDKEQEFILYSEYHIALHLNARYKEADDFFYDKILKLMMIFFFKR